MFRFICKFITFKIFKFRIKGEFPFDKKLVVLVFPHTSNWDFVLLVLCAWHFDLRLQWLGKHTIFKKPFGGFMRALGGVPVDRRSSHNLVDQLKAEYENCEVFHLAIPPAGTRGYRDYWKSGFYHVAVGANVPLVFGFLDYARKEGGIGGVINLTGDVKADMDEIRKFYDQLGARFPERKSRIRLRAEDEADQEAAQQEPPQRAVGM